MSKFLNSLVVVVVVCAAVLFAAVPVAHAEGPIDPATCTWGAKFVKNEQTQMATWVCKTIFEYAADKTGAFIDAEAKKIKSKRQDTVKKIEVYVQKDMKKNTPNLIPVTCNIFQIIKGETSYCTMPQQ